MGHLIVISAPSGTGKTTVIERMLAQNPNVIRAVTCTTRSPRPNEKNGVDYLFLSNAEFDCHIKHDDFLEWAFVHGHRYGTLRKTCEDLLAKGRDVILNIDVQGGASVKRLFPGAILLFLSPPSLEVLETRLRGRGTNDPLDIARRIRDARIELSAQSQYDYNVINDKLDTTVAEVLRIIRGIK